MLSIYCLCTYVNLLERIAQFMQPVNLTCYVESVIDTYEISADEKETLYDTVASWPIKCFCTNWFSY